MSWFKCLTFRGPCIVIYSCNRSHLYFGKQLYMFWTDLLSIIRSLNTVFTATGICHSMNTVLRLLMMDSKSVRNMWSWLLL